VELKSKASEGVQRCTHIEPINDAQDLTLGDDTPPKQQYSIAIGRKKRYIHPPKRYAYVDMVAYDLSVIESIKIPEPSTYKEAINYGEAAE